MNRKYAVQIWISVFILALLITNLVMSFSLNEKLSDICDVGKSQKSQLCEAVPITWAVKNYDCANSLLLAMNVTNVKFQLKNSTNELLQKGIARFKNRSYSD